MFILLQKILPQHGLSKLLSVLAHWRCTAFKNWAIRLFMCYFKVDLTESLTTDINQFACFNDFFIRRLKPGVRPLPHDPLAIACPADGVISELGHIQAGRLLQAKGQYYALIDLLGGDPQLAWRFASGRFCTIYLAPKDYHRVHIPVTGILRQMIHISGQLFSVNHDSVQGISGLFTRNERVVCVFETAVGAMAVILVGALLIGGVVVSWQPGCSVMPNPQSKISVTNYSDYSIILQRGDELGYFQWGSTAIVLFGDGYADWAPYLQAGDTVRMGQNLGLTARP